MLSVDANNPNSGVLDLPTMIIPESIALRAKRLVSEPICCAIKRDPDVATSPLMSFKSLMR